MAYLAISGRHADRIMIDSLIEWRTVGLVTRDVVGHRRAHCRAAVVEALPQVRGELLHVASNQS